MKNFMSSGHAIPTVRFRASANIITYESVFLPPLPLFFQVSKEGVAYWLGVNL
ncbi:MAG: hypothetical protein AAFS12_08615 [Cyanobacteria bacterium J06632_19]